MRRPVAGPLGLPERIETVLFDLDGTLTDPAVGILGSIRHAMNELGRPLAPDVRLDWCIGPPLLESFLRLLDGDEALARAGVAAYRARYGTVGLYENEVHDGVPELLAALVAAGRTLYVATSKPGVFARRILEHFGLAAPFRAVHGSELDGTRAEKTELVPWIVATETIDPATAVMIGDRRHDVAGARAAAIATIGVDWGYAAAGELEAAGAAARVATVTDLQRLILDCG